MECDSRFLELCGRKSETKGVKSVHNIVSLNDQWSVVNHGLSWNIYQRHAMSVKSRSTHQGKIYVASDIGEQPPREVSQTVLTIIRYNNSK